MRKSETPCVWQMFDVARQGDFLRYYQSYFKAGCFPTLKISTPVFIGTVAADRDAPTKMQQQRVQKICKEGTQTEAHVYLDLDHSQTVMRSFDDSRVFARKVSSGKQVAGNCPL